MSRVMLKNRCVFAAGLVVAAGFSECAAVAQMRPLAPPAMYPADTWQGKSVAVVRVLDRLDAHVELLTVPVGTTGHYKSLDIAPRRCLQRPPGLSPDSAVWLDLHDTRKEGASFSGWMLLAEPWVGVFESPGYDVRVVRCEGQDNPPALPPLSVPSVPSLNYTAPSSSVPAQQSVPSSAGVSGSVLQAPSQALPAPSSGQIPNGQTMPEAGGQY